MTMKVLFFSLLLLTTTITGFSQRRIDGDGSDYRESRTVPACNKVGLAVHAEVILVKGNTPGGRIHGDDLSVGGRSKIHISGSGSVNFATDGIIEGRISGSGCISYKGNPSSVDVHHSGSGRARKVA